MYPYYDSSVSSAMRTAKLPSSSIKKQGPENDKRLMKLLEQAISSELADIWYYKALLDKITSVEEAAIVKGIYLDECKHKKIFCDIYQQLFGKKVPLADYEKPVLSSSLLKEYKKRLFDELEAIDFYRKILFALPNLELRDMAFEVLTDEQIHGQKLNFLTCQK